MCSEVPNAFGMKNPPKGSMAAEKPITAADSMLALRAAPASSAWPSRTRRAQFVAEDHRDHAEG